ncbi:TIGR04282 family arsenosugar biosynthesis glycosyltransferase [Flexistipes sinusarabici]|uniref:TIGR04282 family arsenosugar biosynthesis glycosyltransferase n=1 Tax=Flexistipes sinusarabici TaxID=2352 RepID=UPI0026EF1E29|nr:TIGR04282 family arsenosugar biosynthesis glycosyltransferase [Flexistipes sinusarabici]
MKCAKIVFAKYPQAGNVKTRLAADTSDIFASEIYRFLLNRLIFELKNLEDVFWFIDGKKNADKFAQISEYCKVKVQTGENLGEKMYNAFENIFSENNFDSALLIGSDIPGISEDNIKISEESLKNCHYCLGPSNDGGYYLIGAQGRYLRKDIFDGIKWSSSDVYSDTLRKMKEFGKVQLLETLNDIDTLKDLKNEMKSDKKLTSFVEQMYENL